MSYKLTKPFTEAQRLEFIVIHNHNNGLIIEENDTALYALEPWEKLLDDEVVDNKEEFEQEQAKAKRERLDMLSLSKREVFLALYKAKNITPDQLKAQITDPETLIEFEYANDYYRGNPLINLIGQQLGFTSDDLDYLFQNKEFPEQPESVEE